MYSSIGITTISGRSPRTTGSACGGARSCSHRSARAQVERRERAVTAFRHDHVHRDLLDQYVAEEMRLEKRHGREACESLSPMATMNEPMRSARIAPWTGGNRWVHRCCKESRSHQTAVSSPLSYERYE